MTPRIMILGLCMSLYLPMFASTNSYMKIDSIDNGHKTTYAFMRSDVGCSARYKGKVEHLSIDMTNQCPSIYVAIKEMVTINLSKRDICPDQIIIGISPGSMERDDEFSHELSNILVINDKRYGFSHQKYLNITWNGMRVLNNYNREQLKDAVLKTKTINKISELLFQYGLIVDEVGIDKIIMEKPSCKIFSLLSVSYKKKRNRWYVQQ